MKKFWNKAADGTAAIYIYGDITSDRWYDNDTTAKSFVEDLNSFGGQSVTVHINSGGGDVFAALAISNAMKNYSGDVIVSIDGLAASAASLVAMGGSQIKMASNALLMIHAPAVGLLGYYDATELAKIQTSLAAVGQSIIDTYQGRLSRTEAGQETLKTLSTMIESETWLNATQALSGGFIDEVTDAVSIKVDDAQKVMFVNSLAVDIKKFDAAKMRRAMEARSMDINEQSFFDKLKSAITDALTPKNATAPEPPTTGDAEQIRQQELARIRDLQALKCDNKAVNAIVDVAIGNGTSLADLRPYVDALTKVAVPSAQDTADKILAVIRDQLNSGAEGVQGSQPAQSEADERKFNMKRIADFANEQIQGVK